MELEHLLVQFLKKTTNIKNKMIAIYMKKNIAYVKFIMKVYQIMKLYLKMVQGFFVK